MSGAHAVPMPTLAAELTVDWLNQALVNSSVPTIAGIHHEPFGSGYYGSISRIDLTYEGSDKGPASVIAKFAAESPATREALRGIGIYEREVMFYTELAGELAIRTPACYFARVEPETQDTVLLLEYIEGEVYDDVAGATFEQAKSAFALATALHSELSGSPRLDAAWIHPVGGSPVLEGLVAATEAAIPAGSDILRGHAPKWMILNAARAHEIVGAQLTQINKLPHTATHMDFRLSNMIFQAGVATQPTLVDFHGLSRAPGICDLSFFASIALTVDDRREWEDELVRGYLESVHGWQGKQWPDWFEMAWRRFSLFLVYNCMRNATVFDMSDPTTQAFMFAWVERACAMAEDHDALRYLED